MTLDFLGNTTYPIPIVVPTGVVNDTRCEMGLLSVLVEWQSPIGQEKVTKHELNSFHTEFH